MTALEFHPLADVAPGRDTGNGASKPLPQPEKKKTQRGFEPPALRDS